MKLSAESDDYLDGKQEGLSEAAHILEQAIARGETVHTALFEMLDAANKVYVARSMEFDEQRLEFVAREERRVAATSDANA